MNPNIALSLRGVHVPDPSEAYQKALALKSLMGQQEMQGMQLQQAREKMAEDEAIKEAVRSSGGDMSVAVKALLSGGHYDPAMKLQKSSSDANNARLTALKTQGDVSKLHQELQAQHANAILSASPQDAGRVYQLVRQQAIQAGIPGADQSPLQWDERMRPELQAQQMQGLNTKDAMERQDIRSAAGPGVAQALAQPTEAIDQTVPDNPVISRALMPAPAIAETPIDANTQTPIEVTGIADISQKRKRAKELRSMGTHAANEQAKILEDEANKIEGRDIEARRLANAEATHSETQKNREFQQTNAGRQNTLKLADDFRQEPAVKAYRTVAPLSAVMQEAVTRNTAGADVNLVYIVSKVFDPDSVVRDQERATVINSGGLPAYVQSALGYVIGGQRIPDDIRKQLLQEVQSRFGAYKQAYDQISTQYKDTALRFDADHRDIVRHVEIKPEAPIKSIGTDRRKEGKKGANDGWTIERVK